MHKPYADNLIDIRAPWIGAHERCNLTLLARQLRYLARDVAYLTGAALFAGSALYGAISVAIRVATST